MFLRETLLLLWFQRPIILNPSPQVVPALCRVCPDRLKTDEPSPTPSPAAAGGTLNYGSA